MDFEVSSTSKRYVMKELVKWAKMGFTVETTYNAKGNERWHAKTKEGE